MPKKLCGRGCIFKDGKEECVNKQVDSAVDVPEEVCDLQPMKTCRSVTKLLPKLIPQTECSMVPKEFCQLKVVVPKKNFKTYCP